MSSHIFQCVIWILTLWIASSHISWCKCLAIHDTNQAQSIWESFTKSVWFIIDGHTWLRSTSEEMRSPVRKEIRRLRVDFYWTATFFTFSQLGQGLIRAVNGKAFVPNPWLQLFAGWHIKLLKGQIKHTIPSPASSFIPYKYLRMFLLLFSVLNIKTDGILKTAVFSYF